MHWKFSELCKDSGNFLIFLTVLFSLVIAYQTLSFQGQDYTADYVYLTKSGCNLSLHYNISRKMTVEIWKESPESKFNILKADISGEGVLNTVLSNFSGKVGYYLYTGKVWIGGQASPYTLFEEVECK